MILQLDPPLWLTTPKGVGLCHLIIDYGPEHDILWTVIDDATGEIWTWPNPQVRGIPNTSLEARRNGPVGVEGQAPR